MICKLTIDGFHVEIGLVAFVDGNDDRNVCSLCLFNRFNCLRTDPFISCNDENDDIGNFSATGTHRRKCFVAGRIEDCQVTCIDSRNDWIEKLPANPKLRKRCLPEPKSIVPELASNTFFVLMSKGHATDLPVLAEILRSRTPPYVGVIGSAQKASVLRRDLKQLGFAEDRIDSFRCPIGLPLGNNTPAEIAISVAAQLIQVRDQLGVFDHRAKSF